MPDDYDIGYGKPPKSTQFTKGLSGNPTGRPRGARNAATLLLRIAREEIQIKENGRVRTVSKLEAMLLQLANRAGSGDIRAAREFLQWLRFAEEAEDRTPDETARAEIPAEVVQGILRRLRNAELSQRGADLLEEETDEDPDV